jgi:hypothetical protein
MNITTISQVVSDKSDGEIVMAVQAEIKAVYERRPVNAGTDKETSVQNVVLRDSTGEIRCSFWGHSDLSEHKGRTFVFHSNKGPKGIFGLKAKDKPDFKDKSKINRELEVSKSATIQTVEAFQAANGGVTNAAPAAAPVKQTQGNAGQAEPSRSVAARTQSSSLPVSLEMLSNFWECCYLLADAKQKKLSITDDIKQSMTASLFIQGMKENLHFKEELPISATVVADKPKAKEDVPLVDDGTDSDVPF